MGVILGVDGGNSKTELLLATVDGEPAAYVRGPGTNAHGLGFDGCVAALEPLVRRAGLDGAAEYGAFFLCGADVPTDIDALTAALQRTGWTARATVENDTFALLRAGSDAPNAVAIVCGAGINCVGRGTNGRLARPLSLGWETGDWGGSEMLGREVLFHAARAEDGRGEPTELARIVRTHFGASVAEVGEAVHYRRIRETRLGELAPAVVSAAERGDRVARGLVERLAEEVTLLACRALSELGVPDADVVLGGGMLERGRGFFFEEVVRRLRDRAPAARPVVPADPPVVGAALAALDAVGGSKGAGDRLRASFRAGVELHAC